MRKPMTMSLDEKTIKKLETIRDSTFVPIGRQIELALSKSGVLK
jgi:hypothetical protein